jgi:glutathione S-transferase
MTKLKLVYFDIAGSRGEECRLALHLCGLAFDDERLQREAWIDRKPTTPFGSVPVLEVEGKGTLAQSNAILRYIGRTGGMHPTDLWEAARHDALMDAVEDLRHTVSPTLWIKDPDARKTAREGLASGYLQTWGANVDKQIGEGPFVAGEKIHVVDLKLYTIVSWFTKGVLEHIPADVLGRFERLTTVFEAVRNHPKVLEWYSR